MIEHQKLRKSFKPSEIKVLFVAEAPPVNDNFFYSEKSLVRTYTEKAFRTYYGSEISKYLNFKDFFKSEGFYLDDLCHVPTSFKDICKNKNQYIQELSIRLKDYNPKAIIITPLRVDGFVREAIWMSGLAIEPGLIFTLSFPGNGWQNEYIRGLEQALAIMISKGTIK